MTPSDVYHLAERCRVSLHAAFKRADVAYSNTTRWKDGSVPRAETLARLRRGVLAVALEQGTLPPDLEDEARAVHDMPAPPPARSPKEIAQSIAREVEELNRALGA